MEELRFWRNMNNLKKLLVMLMVMTLTLVFVGCGTKNTSDNSNTPQVESNQETYPVDVKDSNGTVVTIEAEPQKIVSVAPNMTELVFALGDGDKLVGRTEYCDYPEEALNVETIGTLYQPNIEAIIALEPDVVLVSTHFDDENVTKLNELGITVVSLYEEKEIYGVYTIIETLGTILNRVEEANAMVDSMKATFDEVAAAIEGQEKPSVYYVVGYGESGDFTAGGDTFVNGLITLAGGDNIAKDVSGWSYTLESLLEADPDIIIIGNGMAADFMTAENYKDLTAVKENHVYEMDKNLLDRQGYRNAEGVKELAKIFYPEIVK